jgi:DNA-binding NtrC family response regulator
VNILYAFVDLKDPFMEAELEGEPQPGPVLSVLESRRFDGVVLFHTGQTEENARRLRTEIFSRHKGCEVGLRPISGGEGNEYSTLLTALAGEFRERDWDFGATHSFACVSSGTPEMRSAWFVLVASGALEATLIRVNYPADPLYGAPEVQEVPLESPVWSRLQRPEMDSAILFSPPAAPPQASPGILRYRVEGAFAKPKAAEAPAPPPQPKVEPALRELGIFVGSAMLQQAVERAAVVAESDLPVLLLGETGTGKDLFAKLVHHLSPRNPRAMVPVNCAAIPKDLVESYLFGHVKGAFTGAASDRPGKFEAADETTLFLDEIGELPLDAQAKLLRVLNDGEVERVGTNRPLRVDVRIIAATNRNLQHEIAAGRFREDLYYRLEVVQIPLPPLRERRAEIPHLAAALLQRINQRRQRPRKLSRHAMQRLESHDWPGNVRELSNVLERSVLYAQKDVLEPEDLLLSSSPASDPFSHLPDPGPGFSLKDFLAQVRTQLVLRALEKSRGNQSEAAEMLGVTKQAVSEFLKARNDNRD